MERLDELRREVDLILQCIAQQKDCHATVDRIRELAISVRRRLHDPAARKAADRILNAAEYLKRDPQRHDTFEPVLVRCIAQLGAALR